MISSLRWVVSLFFPRRCAYCGGVVGARQSACDECSKELNAGVYEKEIALENGGVMRVISAYAYTGKVRNAIRDYKFNGRRRYGENFAIAIKDVILNECLGEKFDIITSVPLSKQGRRERGYNQSEVVARQVGKMLEIPYCEAIKKVKNNHKQHKLGKKDREINVKNVYSAANEKVIYGKKILLCDDIITTGNTLKECAQELIKCGCIKVISVTIAQSQLR